MLQCSWMQHTAQEQLAKRAHPDLAAAVKGPHLKTGAVLDRTKSRRSRTNTLGRDGAFSHFSMASFAAGKTAPSQAGREVQNILTSTGQH